MLQCHIPATNAIVWTLNFHEKACCGDEILSTRPVPWIEISLNWGDMSQRQNKGTRKVASCELFMQHVPAPHFKKPIPATCPFVWTAHEILPRDMFLQHVPSCGTTVPNRPRAHFNTWHCESVMVNKSLLKPRVISVRKQDPRATPERHKLHELVCPSLFLGEERSRARGGGVQCNLIASARARHIIGRITERTLAWREQPPFLSE